MGFLSSRQPEESETLPHRLRPQYESVRRFQSKSKTKSDCLTVSLRQFQINNWNFNKIEREVVCVEGRCRFNISKSQAEYNTFIKIK